MSLLNGSDPGAHRTYGMDPGIQVFMRRKPSRVCAVSEELDRRTRAGGIPNSTCSSAVTKDARGHEKEGNRFNRLPKEGERSFTS